MTGDHRPMGVRLGEQADARAREDAREREPAPAEPFVPVWLRRVRANGWPVQDRTGTIAPRKGYNR